MKLIFALLAAPVLFAQNPDLPDLRAVLNLSDAQVTSLGQFEQQKALAIQPIAQRIQQTQQQLDTLLKNTSPDAASVGRLLIEISGLGRQAQQVVTTFQQQVANLLQADQKTKLQSLSQVLVLQLAAQQAAALGLVGPPSALEAGK